jgi:DNA-binding LacI/PurR family transcriptional regulator
MFSETIRVPATRTTAAGQRTTAVTAAITAIDIGVEPQNWFGIDDHTVIHPATSQLIRLGHRHICYVGGT